MPASSESKSSITSLLELETDEQVFVALDHLSEFYPLQNDEKARQNLQGTIERNSLQTHRKFLESFEVIHDQLGKVEEAVTSMRRTCDHMQSCLNQTNEEAARVISRTQSLQDTRDWTERKRNVVNNYLSKFQLTDNERSILTSSMDTSTNESGDVSMELSLDFFKALQRVQDINLNAKNYLRSKYPNAEIAIKDSLSLTQQAAYDKLYRWIQSQFKFFYKSSPEIEEEMTLAIQAIHDRPVLLQHCLEGIMDVRSSAIHDSFMNALKRGGPNGIPKPIEIHAHDPFRYVGDMLGCLHQLLASEYEFLSSLFFGVSIENSKLLKPVDDTTKHVYKEKISLLLSKSFDKVCKPFQQRVSTVLDSHPGMVTVFRLANLLDFYSRTVVKMIPPESPFVSMCLNECKRNALSEFYQSISQQLNKLLETPPTPPPSLAPPSAIHQILNSLMEIMAVFDSSLVPHDEREREFTPILEAVLGPLLKTCTLSATVLTNECDVAVYMVNCLGLIQNSLAGFSFSSARAEELQGQLDAHMETIVTEEARSMLQKCKLGSKLEIFQEWEKESKESRQPLSYVAHMDNRQLSTAMRSFEESLLDISTMVMPQCEKLFSSRLKSQARSQVYQMIIGAYTSLYNSIMDTSNKYESPSLIVPYEPKQLKTMLSSQD